MINHPRSPRTINLLLTISADYSGDCAMVVDLSRCATEAPGIDAASTGGWKLYTCTQGVKCPKRLGDAAPTIHAHVLQHQ